MQNLITVVIPTHNHYGRFSGLSKLIKSLLVEANIKYIREILVIDNGNSINKEERILFTNQCGLVNFINELKIGLNYARNSGVTNSKGEIVAFLDDDVWVSEIWSKNIISGYDNEKILCVGGPVIMKDIHLIESRIWLSDYFLRFILPPSFPKESSIIKSSHYLIGANMSFRRRVFEEFGVFDLDLDRRGNNLLSNGDIEFLIRIPEGGVWFEPMAIVYGLILKNRISRLFMVRRLFWQGISDYIMVKKRGIKNFHDKDEVLLNIKFFYIVFKKIIGLKLFESFCVFIRFFGFRFGKIYIKKEESRHYGLLSFNNTNNLIGSVLGIIRRVVYFLIDVLSEFN